MKKIGVLLAVMALFSACICKPIVAGLPEGRKVKVDIDDKTFKGELLSITPDMLIIRYFDEKAEQDVLMGFPVPQTEVCKVNKGCGPIGNLFAKNRKFTFKDNPPDKIAANVKDLSYDALYASKIPDWVREQLTLYKQQ